MRSLPGCNWRCEKKKKKRGKGSDVEEDNGIRSETGAAEDDLRERYFVSLSSDERVPEAASNRVVPLAPRGLAANRKFRPERNVCSFFSRFLIDDRENGS